MAFPQSVRVEVHRDSAFILYIDKAEEEHVLWTEMLVGAGGTPALKSYSLVDNIIDDKVSHPTILPHVLVVDLDLFSMRDSSASAPQSS